MSRVVEDNWYVCRDAIMIELLEVPYHSYDGQDMLMRPTSSIGTVSLSTSHSPPLHSPLASPPDVSSGGDVPLYHDVDRAAESSNNGATSSTVVYSETSMSVVRHNPPCTVIIICTHLALYTHFTEYFLQVILHCDFILFTEKSGSIP